MIRKVLAGGILTAVGALSTTMIGAHIRGYEEGAVRDFLTGAAVLGSAAAIQWAFRQFDQEGES